MNAAESFGAAHGVGRSVSRGQPDAARLTRLDRVLLMLPTLVGILLGLASLLIAAPFARFAGYSGNDEFFYRLAGAATLGYGVALAVGIRGGSWRAIRSIVIAELVFQVVLLFACVVETSGGTGKPIIYVTGAAALAQAVIAVWVLSEHRGAPLGPPNIPGGALALAVMSIAILAAATFGILGAFFPVATTHFFGYQGTEVFLYRLAGAATLGYAVMGIFNLRSRNWAEVRLPVLMAIVFNGVSFLAAILAIVQGDPLFLPILIALATFVVTVPMTYAFATTRISG
jgi:hypothetical protein